MVRSEGNMSLKNPVTPPGIDPGIVRLVAHSLNHYSTPGLPKNRLGLCKCTEKGAMKCLRDLLPIGWVLRFFRMRYFKIKKEKTVTQKAFCGT